MITRYTRIVFVVVALAMVSGRGAVAAAPSRWDPTLEVATTPGPAATTGVGFLGQWGGSAQAVAASDDGRRVFYGQGSRLVAADVSDPAHVVILGRSQPTAGIIKRIVFRNSLAYVAADRAGLLVFDLSDPSTLLKIGNFAAVHSAADVEIQGSLAYIADRNRGLVIVDISDPSNPAEAGWLDVPEEATGVAVDGNQAFLVSNSYSPPMGSRLRIVDVSDPRSPSVVHTMSFPGPNLRDVAAVEGYLFVAELMGTSRFIVYDVSDPANPRPVGSVTVDDSWGLVSRITVNEPYAYVVGLNKLSVFDISDPTHPTRAFTVEPLDYAVDAAATSNLILIADQEIGLHLVENSSQITQLKPLFSRASEVTMADSFAYVLGSADRSHSVLQVFDISDPLKWQARSSVMLPGVAAPLAVSSGYAFTTIQGDPGESHFVSIDVRDPLHPVVVNTLAGDYWAWGIDLAEVAQRRLVFLAALDQGLLILDVTDPAHPALVSQTQIGNAALRVAVQGARAYMMVAGDSGGWDLHIIDVSVPTAPQLIGAFDWSDAGYDLAVQGNYLYTANAQGGYSVFDVTNPLDPRLLSTVRTPGSGHALWIDERHVYLGTTYGIHIFTGEDATLPQAESFFPIANSVVDLVVLPEQLELGTAWEATSSKTPRAYLAIAADEAGLAVVLLDEPLPPQPPVIYLPSVQVSR